MSLIIFDLDGTLAETNGDLADSVNDVRMALGMSPIPDRTITALLGCGIYDLMKNAIPELKTKEDQEKAVAMQIKCYDERITNRTRLYEGVTGTLALMSERHTLTVFTNKVMYQAQTILDRLDASKYFRCIIGNARDIPLKPAPEAVRYAAEKSGCTLDGAWIVGDNWTDLLAGVNAGIKTCFCSYGFGHSRGIRCDASIASFDLLTEVIK